MSGIYILALTSIFVILVVLVFKSLKQAGIFNGSTTLVLTICTALLAILGLARFESLPTATTPIPAQHHIFELDLVLLPYGAMAIAMLLTILVWLFLKLFGGKRKSWPSEQGDPRVNRSKKQRLFPDHLCRPSKTATKNSQPDDRYNRVERQLYIHDESENINRD